MAESDAYRTHILAVVRWSLATPQYFTRAEQATLRAFCAADAADAQRLLARLLPRRGSWFRTADLRRRYGAALTAPAAHSS